MYFSMLVYASCFIDLILQGHLARAQVEGEIKIRSFLKGNPKVKLSMNQDLVVGRETLDGNKSV